MNLCLNSKLSKMLSLLKQNKIKGNTNCSSNCFYFSVLRSQESWKIRRRIVNGSTKVNFLFNGHGVRRSVNIVASRWPSSGAGTALFKCHCEIPLHAMPTPFSPYSWILNCHSPHDAINFLFVCLARSWDLLIVLFFVLMIYVHCLRYSYTLLLWLHRVNLT